MAQGEQENKAENKQPEEEVLQHLQILLNQNQDPNITDEILSKMDPWKTDPCKVCAINNKLS